MDTLVSQNVIEKAKPTGLVRGIQWLCDVAQWISRACLLAMTVIIGWQVYARYVLNSSPSWSETTSISLMGWFVLVGAGAAVRYRDHLGFTVGLILMPPHLRRWVVIAGDVLVGLFGAGMFVFGLDLIMGTWKVLMPGSFLPQGAHYIPLSVSGVLICLFSLEKVVEGIQNKSKEAAWNR